MVIDPYQWSNHSDQKACNHRRDEIAVRRMFGILEFSPRQTAAAGGLVTQRIKTLCSPDLTIFLISLTGFHRNYT